MVLLAAGCGGGAGDAGNSEAPRLTLGGSVSGLTGSGLVLANGNDTVASFNRPRSVAVDASGNVYVGHQSNHRIRKISPDGVVRTLAGTGVVGSADGSVSDAEFNNPQGVAVVARGEVYVADNGNNKVRKIAQD